MNEAIIEIAGMPIKHPASDQARSLLQAVARTESTAEVISLVERAASALSLEPRKLWPMALAGLDAVDWSLMVHLAHLDQDKDTALKPWGPNTTLVKAWHIHSLASVIEEVMVAQSDTWSQKHNKTSEENDKRVWGLWLEAWRMAGHGETDGPLRKCLRYHLLPIFANRPPWADEIGGQLYATAIESMSTPDECLAGALGMAPMGNNIIQALAHPLSGPAVLDTVATHLVRTDGRVSIAKALWAHPASLTTMSMRAWMLSMPWEVGQHTLVLPCWPQGHESPAEASFLIERAIRGDIISQTPGRRGKFNDKIWVTPAALGATTASDLLDSEAIERIRKVMSVDTLSYLTQSPVMGVRLAAQTQIAPLLD